MVKRKIRTWGQQVHPSPSRGHGEQIGLTPFRRCVQCGMPNDTRTTAWAKAGDGLVEIKDSNPLDRDVKSGCAHCGSLQWLRDKPVKLPDGNKLPTPEVVRMSRNRR